MVFFRTASSPHQGFTFRLASTVFFVGAIIFWAMPEQAVALQITPAIVRRDVRLGETQEITFALRNELLVPVKISAEILGVQIDQERNAPIVVDDDQNIFHSARSWVRPPKTLPAIPAGDTAKVAFTVAVPPQAEPGGWSAAIAFTARPTTAPEEQAINITSRVVSVLLLSVPGDVVIKEKILEFSTDKKLYFALPVRFHIVYANEGTVHTTPLAPVIIRDWFGRERDVQLLNPRVLSVMPKTTRVFDVVWGDGWGLAGSTGAKHWWSNLRPLRLWGRLKAEVTVGPLGDTHTATTTFWLIPLWPIIFIALILFSVFVWYKRRLRAMRPGRGDI